jgi:lipopolysaccharide export system protein LptC
MLTTRLFPLLLMLSLALLTFWLERTVHDDPTKPPTRRHDPDYIVEKFTTTIYNRDGVAESTLSAERMLHYPDDDTTELHAPRVVQTKPREPRITLSAARGQLSRDGDEIFLYGERSAARMTTSFLHVVRDRSLVRTNRPVEIVEEGRSLSGRGMEYDNQSGSFTLHADVQGRYLSKPQP